MAVLVGPMSKQAREHDQAVEACLSTLLYGDAASPLPATAASAAHLPLGYGGLGLRPAAAGAQAAYYASSPLPHVRERLDLLQEGLQGLYNMVERVCTQLD